ncbi:hypothetical protein JCM10213v2_007249 [Rhodosporidiobolus nylandii]
MAGTRPEGPPIFTLPPEGCSRFARTCKAAHTVVQSSSLWRALHRAAFDPPPPSATEDPSAQPYEYARQVQRRTRAETLLLALEKDSAHVPGGELVALLATLVDLAVSRTADPESRNEAFLALHLPLTSTAILALHPTFSRSNARVLRSSSAAGKAASPSSAELDARKQISQLASHLHTLATPSPLALASPSIRTAAREIVYEKGNFSRLTGWGPLMSDGSGRVDWRKVEALAMVMKANMSDAESLGWGDDHEEDDKAVIPGGWGSTRRGSAGPVRTDAGGRDWAGVESREWRGSYAFLHFPIWHHFNFHRSGPFTPTLADEHEAVGDCMSLKLKLLPEGEWPDEIDVPDLSAEALERALDETDEEDEDWVGSGAEDEGSEASDDGEGDDYYTTTGGPAAASSSSAARAASDPPRRPRRRSTADSPHSDDDDQGMSFSSDEDLMATRPYSPAPFQPPPVSSSSGPAPLSPGPLTTTFSPPSNTFGPSAFSPSVSSQETPKLAFAGTFSAPAMGQGSAHLQAPNDRAIRGTVEMAPDGSGAVRWSYVIRYAGMDQWAMNGIQITVGSRTGVVGVWTSADRAEEGPCGPFWYWPHIPAHEDVEAPVA